MSVQDPVLSALPLPPGYRVRRWVVEPELKPMRLGRAYRARDSDRDLVAAINVLSPELGHEGVARFLFCTKRAAETHGDRLLELGEHLGTYYVAVAYVEGVGPTLDVGEC